MTWLVAVALFVLGAVAGVTTERAVTRGLLRRTLLKIAGLKDPRASYAEAILRRLLASMDKGWRLS